MALITSGLHLVKETSSSTGNTTPTFNFTLLGAESGFEAFEDRLGIGNQTWCYVRHNTAWMYFLGTLTAYNTLRTDTIIASSDSNNPLVLGSGTKQVYIGFSMEAILGLLPTSVSIGRIMALINGSHAV